MALCVTVKRGFGLRVLLANNVSAMLSKIHLSITHDKCSHVTIRNDINSKHNS